VDGNRRKKVRNNRMSSKPNLGKHGSREQRVLTYRSSPARRRSKCAWRQLECPRDGGGRDDRSNGAGAARTGLSRAVRRADDHVGEINFAASAIDRLFTSHRRCVARRHMTQSPEGSSGIGQLNCGDNLVLARICGATGHRTTIG